MMHSKSLGQGLAHGKWSVNVRLFCYENDLFLQLNFRIILTIKSHWDLDWDDLYLIG